MRKIILLFLDLEGTLTEETDGEYSDEDMYKFLGQVSELQELTDSDVHLHIVSPIDKKYMKKIVDKVDRNIMYYNRLHLNKKEISFIESASCSAESQLLGDEFLDDKIIPLKRIHTADFSDYSIYGKLNYVENWYNIYDESSRNELSMVIYGGNGNNDVSAMKFVKGLKDRGFIIAPQNSVHDVKNIATYVSPNQSLSGIADGIKNINEQIRSRNEETLPTDKGHTVDF